MFHLQLLQSYAWQERVRYVSSEAAVELKTERPARPMIGHSDHTYWKHSDFKHQSVE